MNDVFYWVMFGLMMVSAAVNAVSFVRNMKLHKRLSEMYSRMGATLTNKEK